MSASLSGKRIVLGITGSIAAYKSADLVRRLREAGAIVRVTMTENAKVFITPLTMQAVSGFPVHDNLFDLEAEAAMGHIELAKWADLILIAPASAGFIARLAHGMADDLLTTLCLATTAKIAIAPAMNQAMWAASLTQANIATLIKHHIKVLGPGAGSQACGDVGLGRMLEPLDILTMIDQLFMSHELAGCKVLITAGPTRETIDPIRYLSNKSSGKMGYALADAAREAGADVTLITGPTTIPLPKNINVIHVTTALEMHDAVMNRIAEYDIFIAVAAVADYRAKHTADHKIAKTHETLHIELIRNPDIAKAVGELNNKPFLVGFAAETEDVIQKAKRKREVKHMDLIVANLVAEGVGMESDENAVTVISKDDEITLPLMPKTALARQLINIISQKRDHYERTNRNSK